MPKVSVIIPAYNCEKYIAQTLESVFAQTHKNLEVIVVNDGSKDNTEEALKPYRSRIKYVYQDNQGIAVARNRALQEATGEFAAFIDGDDLWLPQKIEKQVKVFQQYPELGFVCTATYVINGQGDVTAQWKMPKRATCTFERLYEENFVFNSTVMARRQCIEDAGRLDPSLLMSQDYDLWLRLAKRNKFYYLNELLSKYRRHGNNISKDYFKRVKNHLRILCKPELRGHLTDQELYLEVTKRYVYFAEHAAKEKRYFITANFYARALLRLPHIGMYYWPQETWGKRFTLPYRILKFYYYPVKHFILGIYGKLAYAQS